MNDCVKCKIKKKKKTCRMTYLLLIKETLVIFIVIYLTLRYRNLNGVDL